MAQSFDEFWNEKKSPEPETFDTFWNEKKSEDFDAFWSEPPEEAGILDVAGRTASDLAVSFGSGTNSLMKLGGDLYGLATGDMENYFSEQGQRGLDYYSAKKSDYLKAQERERAMSVARADGEWNKAKAAFWGTLGSPALMTSFLVEQLPMLAATAGGGAAVGGGAKLLGASTKVAGQAGKAGAIVTGAGMAGADAGKSAYDQILEIPDDYWAGNEEFNRLSEKVGAEQAKKDIALDLSQDAAITAAITSGALNYLIPGAGKLEELLGTGGRFLTKGTKGRLTNTITGLLGEGVQEAIEEGSVPLLGNLAVQNINSDQGTFEGVGEAAGMGAVGGAFGGAAGAIQPVESLADANLRDAINEGFQQGQEKDIAASVDRVFSQMTVADSIDAMQQELDESDEPAPLSPEAPEEPAKTAAELLDESIANDLGVEPVVETAPFTSEELWAENLAPGSERRQQPEQPQERVETIAPSTEVEQTDEERESLIQSYADELLADDAILSDPEAFEGKIEELANSYNLTPEQISRVRNIAQQRMLDLEPEFELGAQQGPTEVIYNNEPSTESSVGDQRTGSPLPTVEIPLQDLGLSPDVPQFKSGANQQTGVVEPLGGKFERVGVAPIVVWERLNGKLEVISGRHRMDLAKRSGEQTIPGQILREADGITAEKAGILDAEMNLRDGQGKVKDYVKYFKGTGIDRDTADARGLLAREKGKRAFEVADSGADEVVAAHSNGQITDAQAYTIAQTAPKDSRIQSVGLRAAGEGKTLADIANLMRAVQMTDTGAESGDMFGFDDSAMVLAEKMAKAASKKQREISTDLSAVRGAAKNPEVAKKYGVNVNNPDQLRKKIEQLTQDRAAWEQWHTNPELRAQIQAEVSETGDAINEPGAKYEINEDEMYDTLPNDMIPPSQRTPEKMAARAARKAQKEEMIAKIKPGAVFANGAGDLMYTVTKAVNTDKQFQVTVWDKDGPMSDTKHDTLEDIAFTYGIDFKRESSPAEFDNMVSESETEYKLEGETEGRRLQREQREAARAEIKAEAEKAAAQKEKADREIGDFTLTGSDSQADQAAARGQTSLFDGISEEESAEYNVAKSPRNESLRGKAKEVESRIAEKIEGSTFQQLYAEYSLDPESGPDVGLPPGSVINPDIGRNLSSDYKLDKTLANAVHSPVSDWTKRLFDYKLRQSHEEGSPVLFTGGGSGAGKSSGFALIGDRLQDIEFVVDGTLAGYEKSKSQIDRVLESGRQVDIVFTYRDPFETFENGIVRRALSDGRTVPISIFAEAHQLALENIRKLEQDYAGNPDVEIVIIDNSRGAGNAAVSDTSQLPKEVDANEVKRQSEIRAKELLEEGKITQQIYNGLIEGSEDSGGNGVQPEQSRSQQADSVAREEAADYEAPGLGPAYEFKRDLELDWGDGKPIFFVDEMTEEPVLVTTRDLFDVNPPDSFYSAEGLGLTGGEADAWVAATAKGLDMSKPARMERAEEQGFDTGTVYYRGQTGDLSPDSNPRVSFYSDDPGLAASFAMKRMERSWPQAIYNGGEGRIGVELSSGRTEIISKESAVERFGEGLSDRALAEGAVKLTDQESVQATRFVRNKKSEDSTPNTTPVFVKPQFLWDFRNADHRALLDDVMQQLPSYQDMLVAGDYIVVELPPVQKAIKGAGFDGFYVVENSPYAKDAVNIGLFPGKNIARSVNAAFDPDNADSNNLLAEPGAAYGTKSKALATEIDSLMEMYEGSEENPDYNEDDALSDVLDKAESDEEWTYLLKPARELAIKKGWYAPVSDKALAERVVSSGSKYDFKLNGVKYDWVGRDGGGETDVDVEPLLLEPEAQYDMFDEPATPPVEDLPENSYSTIVKNQEIYKVNVGTTKVNSPEDALHIIAPFRKAGQETLLAIAMDDAGNVLEIQQHSIGDISQAAVNPALALGAVASTGATKVMFAHNHPSGTAYQSTADVRLTQNLASLGRSSGIKVEGMVVIAPGGDGSFFDGDISRSFSESRTPTPMARSSALPVTVRKFKKKISTDGQGIDSPLKAKEVVKGKPDGVLFLNNQNEPVGHFPMTPEGMMDLTGERANQLLKALHLTNAAAVIVNGNEDILLEGSNVVSFFNNTNLRVLDILSDGNSLAEKGPFTTNKFFHSRDGGQPTNYTAEQAQVQVDKLNNSINRVGAQVEIIRASQLPPGVAPDSKGYTDGTKFYLVHDRITGDQDLAVTYAHELVGHIGVENVVKDWKTLENNYKVLRGSTNAEVRSIEAELDARYGADLDPSDRLREFIAVASERQIKKGPVAQFIDKVKVAMNKGLRALGIERPFGMTDINEILGASRAFLNDPNNRVDTVAARDLQREHASLVDATPLPMTDADRMARAKEQGYDTSTELYSSGTVGGAFRLVPGRNPYTDGANPVLARFNNPMTISPEADVNQAVLDAREGGFDGVIVRGPQGIEAALSFDSNNIRSTKSPFNPAFQSLGSLYSSRDNLTPGQRIALNKIGRPASAVGRVEAFKQKYQETTSRIGVKMRQGIFDQFASFRLVLDDERAWMMSQLTKATTQAVEAAVEHGQLFLEDGAIGVNTSTKGLKDAVLELGEDLDSWLGWMAGNRAERLMAQDRENLFSREDIQELKSLADGKEELFNRVRNDFEALNASITQIAVDTGLVSEQDAAMWREEGFYLPFYRVMESSGGMSGPNVKSGSLVRQEAFKQLKGGKENINDLLENVLMNWNHLITASMNNQAARQALSSAVKLGLARPMAKSADGGIAAGEEFALSEEVQRITRDEAGDLAVYVKINGKQQWYALDDSTEGRLVLESLTGLNWEGLNGGTMKAMRAFKHALTTGVTVSPEFKIRNLIRDSIQAAAATGASANIAKNLYQGGRAAMKGSESYAQALAGGGIFSDSGYIHGADPEAIRYALRKGVGRDTILDTRWRIKKVFDKYQEWGAVGENINRMAEYQQALNDNRGDRLTRAFNSRDHIDFTRTGAWTSIRAISQMVPFFNARLQGLDKLGRSAMDPEARRKFALVGGTYVAMSVGLYLMMRGDEDYEELEQWERDAYHVFKLPGSEVMYRIPRPFEIGAIASLTERVAEQMVDDEVHGELFAERLQHALGQTFSFNPTPQLVRPALEVAMDKNWFTQRAIEGQSMKNLSPENRKRAWTSETAIAMSQGMAKVLWEDVTLSPVQIEHLVRGYFGWAGGTALSAIDTLVTRPATDSPVPPAMRATEWPVVRTLVKTMPNKNTKYTTMFYERLDEINRAYADIRQAKQLGEINKAIELSEENMDILSLRKQYNRISNRLSNISQLMSKVRLDKTMSAEEKRDWIDQLTIQKNNLTKVVGQQTDRRLNGLDE